MRLRKNEVKNDVEARAGVEPTYMDLQSSA